MTLRIGEVFRYSTSKDAKAKVPVVDGLPNFYFATDRPGHKGASLMSGINYMAAINSPDGPRRPAIVINSNPFKAGTRDTPWQDTFNIDTGSITYFGDNKSADKKPGDSGGNKVLLEEFDLQIPNRVSERLRIAPLIFFKAVQHGSDRQGHYAFMGVGAIEKVSLVTQYSQKEKLYFPNYRYDIAVFDLSNENEELNWQWIIDRSDKSLSNKESNKHAPQSWMKWVNSSDSSFEPIRRQVSRNIVKTTAERKPTGDLAKVLDKIYKRFHGLKAAFELLAMNITGNILNKNGNVFRSGWVSPRSGDGGVDFVGKLVLATDLVLDSNLVVLGQAKCVKPDGTTSGEALARTVSRLQRGWIGAFVTTNQFTKHAQIEAFEDKYPLLLIDGRRVAEETKLLATASGMSLDAYLDFVIDDYPNRIRHARPEQVLDAS